MASPTESASLSLSVLKYLQVFPETQFITDSLKQLICWFNGARILQWLHLTLEANDPIFQWGLHDF